ncbi:MAG: AraC family transcriptional regulator [Acidimicrobiia bacterium]
MPNRPRSTYRELPPPPALAPYVACLWVQEIGDGDEAYDQPVLPDACIDIISGGEDVVVAGPATRSSTARLVPGSLTVGIRFRPGAAPPLLGVGAVELRDQDATLSEVWGRAAAATVARTTDVSDWRSRLDVLVDGLVDRLDGASPADRVATLTVAALADRPGQPVHRLADDAALSERQLRRRVEAAVGYPPRMLARILRFQRFLGAARAARSDRRDLAGLAAEIGYADQAHLTRESRRLAGLPPAALLGWEAERLEGFGSARSAR